MRGAFKQIAYVIQPTLPKRGNRSAAIILKLTWIYSIMLHRLCSRFESGQRRTNRNRRRAIGDTCLQASPESILDNQILDVARFSQGDCVRYFEPLPVGVECLTIPH